MQGEERDTVLHGWCVQSDWHAPTVVGGAGARFLDPMAVNTLARGVSFAARGNLLLLAPPLVIAQADLDQALSLLDELLQQVDVEITRETQTP